MIARLKLSPIVELRCPRAECRGPVYVPGDSADEIVDCTTCESPLVTKRTLGNELYLETVEHQW